MFIVKIIFVLFLKMLKISIKNGQKNIEKDINGLLFWLLFLR
jgi:hypothetical protein